MSIWAIIGFLFAAYAVVGNDALQTLGTFINSNRRLPWWALFLFAGAILVITFLIGWLNFNGDPSWGRLSNAAKYPVFDVHWYHVVPAFALLLLTRFGIPVSTSFMILTIFATAAGMQSMMMKSLYAYAVAFGVGLTLYMVLAPTIERHFLKTPEHSQRLVWIVLQWVATAYLWGAWLVQDLANIFVFLPRQLTPLEAFASVGTLLVLLLITFAIGGGPVQKIIRSKTCVTDIRSATIIDFVYASLLAYFAYVSKTPMSTTWAFLGFIGGREFAIATIDRVRSPGGTFKIVFSDLTKAGIGLGVSILMATYLPPFAAKLGDSIQAAQFNWILVGSFGAILALAVAAPLLLKQRRNHAAAVEA